MNVSSQPMAMESAAPVATPSWAPDEEITFYGRARFEISPAGVTPQWGVILPGGPLTQSDVLSGKILIVGSFGTEVRWTTTDIDPREVHGTPDPRTGEHFFAMMDIGLLTVSFPGQHVQSPDHLRASTFDVYELGVVPFDIEVTPSNIAALLRGATLLGSAAGSDMLDLYF
jgi:hypothetical protein